MGGQPRGEPTGRLGALLALAALPALVVTLLSAGLAWQAGRAELVATLEARARDHLLAVEAVLVGSVDAEAQVEAIARDVAGARERVGALVAALDWPVGSVRLLDAGIGTDPATADGSPEPDLRILQPVAGGLLLEHRVSAGVLRRAAASAAAPWLLAALALGPALALGGLLLRRLLLAPAVAALDALVDAAGGLPGAGGRPAGWAAPWLEAGRGAARLQAERLAAAEAAEAPLGAALEAIGEGVAILRPDGRVAFANRAFVERLRGLGIPPADPAAGLDPSVRAALARAAGLRELPLASGGSLLLLPSGASDETAAGARLVPAISGPAGPRLAAMVQEVGEALALVARQAVLLHELSTDPAIRQRAEQMRRACERCTRAIEPLLLPPRRPRSGTVAVDRLLEARLERLRRDGIEVVAGLAPGLLPVGGDPDRLADLLDGVLAVARQLPGEADAIRLRVRLRRGEAGLRLEVERPAVESQGRPPGLALLELRARELGAALAVGATVDGGRLLRLDLPLQRPRTAEPGLGRLVVIEGERGAA